MAGYLEGRHDVTFARIRCSLQLLFMHHYTYFPAECKCEWTCTGGVAIHAVMVQELDPIAFWAPLPISQLTWHTPIYG